MCSPAWATQDHALAVEQCIAENSGAGSVACFEKIFLENQRKITGLERALIRALKQKRQTDDFGETHYQLAVSSLRDASKKFAAFSQRQCDFAIGASGATASGSDQVRWPCLIRLSCPWR